MITDKLMVGNCIDFEGSLIQVTDVLCDSVNTTEHEALPYDMIMPIPITPDILDKCGFESYDKGQAEFYDIYKTKNGIFISMAKVDIPYGFMDLKDRWYIGDPHTEIKSLHHLQNYVYCVYNTELTINL